ncbi:MAG: signal recognition particle-docking protein FtsY [bacterium]
MFDIFKKNTKTDNPAETEENKPKSKFGISLSTLKEAISKTSESLVGNILSITQGKQEIDDDLIDEMEEKLIKADLGVKTTIEIIEKLRNNKNKIKPTAIKDFLKENFIEIIRAAGSNNLIIKDNQLNIMLITGVNGVGKTTLIGKLAYRFKSEGKQVIVAAGDTFRAAAEEQLEIWTNRAGVEIIRQDGADPAAVVFDSIKSAKAKNADILLIDTAGRLQNKINLMEELKKIKKVIDREAPESLVESMLVLDATTGQNGLRQAEIYKEAVQLTSVGLTKLDGTAKGGIIVAIAKEFELPVKLIGIGEKLEDLKDFNADDFVDALFG